MCVALLIFGFSFGGSIFAENTKIEKDTYQDKSELRTGDSYDDLDKIDPYSGNLSIQQKDITLGNNGGFNFEVVRSYNLSNIFFGGEEDYYRRSSKNVGLGWGWSLNVAPKIILTGASTDVIAERLAPVQSYDYICTKNPAHIPKATYLLEHVDGRMESLFLDNEKLSLRSSSNWKLTCDASGNRILFSPDGISYVFNKEKTHVIVAYENMKNPAYNDETRPAMSLIFQASRIMDKSGNWFSIEYQNLTDARIFGSIDAFSSYSYLSTAMKLPSIVTSSDHQILRFFYDDSVAGVSYENPGRAARLNKIVRSDGAFWEYKYKNTATQNAPPKGIYNPPSQIYSLLTEVIRPDGTSWKFDYWDHVPYDYRNEPHPRFGIPSRRGASDKLKKMTNPLGGSIAYEYEASVAFGRWLESWEGGDVLEARDGLLSQNLRVKKRSTSDGGVWNYTYSPGKIKNQYDITIVDGPDGYVQYKHIGVNFFNPSIVDSSPLELVWGYGFYVYDVAWKVGLMVEKKIGDNYIEKYSWGSRDYSWQRNVVAGRVGLVDQPAKAAQLVEKIISMDGVNYVTNFSNIDAFGNVGRVVEAGPNGGNKTTNYTYQVNLNKWILHSMKNEDFADNFIVRDFDQNGNVIYMNKNGLVTRYEYDAFGNNSLMVLPGGATNYYANYKRGIAQTTTQPEGVVTSKSVDDFGNIISETNGEGKTTSYTYDGLNRVLSINYPVGNGKVFSYGGNYQSVVRGNLAETTYFDGFGRALNVSIEAR